MRAVVLPEAAGHKTDGALIVSDKVRHQMVLSNSFRERIILDYSYTFLVLTIFNVLVTICFITYLVKWSRGAWQSLLASRRRKGTDQRSRPVTSYIHKCSEE